jgi:hypothetical protein
VALAPARVVEEQVDARDLGRIATSGRRSRLLVMGVLLVLYAFGQPWYQRGLNRDIESTSIPAWHFVETGSWDLTPFESVDGWFVETQSGLRSNRTPGIIAVAVLGYALTAPFTKGFDEWPSTLVAAVTSWLAVLVVAATAERLKKGTWLAAVVLFGLGTATWGVSAMHLWPHGPAQLAIALAVWFLVQEKETHAGLAFAVAILIRPPVAAIAVGVAIVKAVSQRTWRPVLTLAAPAAAACALYLTYTRIIFGSSSPLASYDAVGGLEGNEGLLDWVGNVASAFVGPSNGVLVWSIWIVLCLVAWRSMREHVPTWLFVTPLLAALYVILHSSLEIASGALPYNYRYQLEAVTVAAPLLIAGLPGHESSRGRQVIIAIAVASSVFLQAAAVFVSRCWFEHSARVCSLLG